MKGKQLWLQYLATLAEDYMLYFRLVRHLYRPQVNSMSSMTSIMPNAPAHCAVVVRSLLAVTPEDREAILQDVEYNVFAFPAGLLTCDFLSDSGTSAMTDVQWAACKCSSATPLF